MSKRRCEADADDRPSASKRLRPTESSVGITEFVDPSIPAFSAIIKHKFTDFLVYEVDLDDKVVRLTDVHLPKEDFQQPSVPQTSLDDNWETVSAQLSAEVSEKLKIFFEAGPQKDRAACVSTKPITSKSDRTAIHQLVRETFGGRLLTETRQDGDNQLIDILWKKGNSQSDRRSKPALPPYIHFTLLKYNRESHDALGQVSRIIRAHIKELGIAGTKDKRAVTTQRVSLKTNRRTLKQVFQAINRERMSGIRIGNFEYAKSAIELGQLKGNRFVITLRDVQAESEEVVNRAVSVVKDRGFINYFGMQRFGNAEVSTQSIGLALLQSDWEKAVELIMSEREHESEEVKEARRKWNVDKDAKASLESLQRQMIAERAVMQAFVKQKEHVDKLDYAAALVAIPKNLKMMYIHAYQSMLWNIVLSERIRLFGCNGPIEGDLVWAEDSEQAVSVDTSLIESSELTSEQLEKVLKNTKRQLVKALTKEDLKKHTIFDVLLPLPGFIVQYPSGALGEMYEKMMRADGLNPHDMVRKQPEYSMSGTYRKILHKPSDFTHQLLHYDDPDQPLASTDDDVLSGRSRLTPADFQSGKYTALRVEFTLASSTYATMALREILKSDTSSMNQKSNTEKMHERIAQENATAFQAALEEVEAATS